MATDATDSKPKPEIRGDMLISELVAHYPAVVDFLIKEYAFHCVNCLISGFENLEDGARVHGIEGEEFEELLAELALLC